MDKSNPPWPLAPLLLLLLPLLAAIWWHPPLADTAYITLRHSQNVAAGRGLLFDQLAGGDAAPLHAPLLLALLLPFAWLEQPLPTIILTNGALFLSALGWGFAALALYQLGRHRLPASGLIFLLLGLSLLLLATAGLATGWLVGWLALALNRQPADKGQTAVLTLLLLTHFDAATLLLTLLLWLHQPIRRRGIMLATVAILWSLLLWSQLGSSGLWLTLGQLAPGQLPQTVAQLWRESQLYLLWLPLGWLGMRQLSGKALSMTTLWLFGAAVVGSPVAGSLTAVFLLILLLLGLHSLQPRLGKRVTTLLALLVAVPLLASLWQRHPAPLRQHAIVEEALAARVYQQQAKTDTVASPTYRLAFLADQPRQAVAVTVPAALPTLLGQLDTAPPAVVISSRTITWDFLTRTGWFRQRYQLDSTLHQPIDPLAPYQIWRYQESGFDGGEERPLTIHSDHGIDLVGVQLAPNRIQPGDPVYLTLTLQATHPISQAFRTVVRVIDPLDGLGWGQLDELRPISRPLDWWQPGQTIRERFLLPTVADIPSGVYKIDVGLGAGQDEALWPLTTADGHTAAHMVVGQIVVPWQGDSRHAAPVAATFGDQIRLAAAAVDEAPRPGQPLLVQLFWEALRLPDADYTVFVHLLAADGQLVTNHDAPPQNGRFPTTAWIPGERIGDDHPLALPADLPPGRYQIKVGLYLPSSGERLPVWDSDQVAQPDHALLLTTIEIGE